ncbi:MAG: type II secretion system F family protein [Verrucomicrobiales bacterium]|nr:type II secretion system F family protein [Verrucomicrobiales bacterium]
MSLIVSPRQLTRRAELYHQLGSTVAAGIPLIQALEIISNTPGARALRKPLRQLIVQLHQGSTFSEALLALGRWLPEFDVALLSAGEKSGRLDACFRLLADYYGERARLLRSVIADLAYPLLILHVAIFVFPPDSLTSLVMQGNVAGFALAKLKMVLPLYGLVFFLVFACQGKHGEAWRSLIERVVRGIPILGAARRNLALARLSAALEGLISAGVSIIEAWELAAAASGSPALRRTVFAWRPSVLAGQTPAEMVRASGAFPDLFASLYNSGEVSGQLDETLRRLYKHYQEEGSRKLHAVAQWTPRLIYFLVLLGIAYSVVSFWTNYYGNLLNNF